MGHLTRLTVGEREEEENVVDNWDNDLKIKLSALMMGAARNGSPQEILEKNILVCRNHSWSPGLGPLD